MNKLSLVERNNISPEDLWSSNVYLYVIIVSFGMVIY